MLPKKIRLKSYKKKSKTRINEISNVLMIPMWSVLSSFLNWTLMDFFSIFSSKLLFNITIDHWRSFTLMQISIIWSKLKPTKQLTEQKLFHLFYCRHFPSILDSVNENSHWSWEKNCSMNGGDMNWKTWWNLS